MQKRLLRHSNDLVGRANRLLCSHAGLARLDFVSSTLRRRAGEQIDTPALRGFAATAKMTSCGQTQSHWYETLSGGGVAKGRYGRGKNSTSLQRPLVEFAAAQNEQRCRGDAARPCQALEPDAIDLYQVDR